MGGYDEEQSSYRGVQWRAPVKEHKRIVSYRGKPSPADYGPGDIQVGDSVYIIPSCAMESDPGSTGVAVPVDGPAWLEERGWIGVHRDDTHETSNYRKVCLLKKL